MAQEQGFGGNTATTSWGGRWHTYIEMRISSYGETAAWVQWRRVVIVDYGNFEANYTTSWGGVSVSGGPGWYGDTGWQDIGWVSYGQGVSQSAWAYFYPYTGGTSRSDVSAWYVPNAPTWAPNNTSNARVTSQSDSTISIAWQNNITAARPYDGVYVDRSVDDSDFSLLADVSGSTTSYTDKSVSANHYYRYRTIPHNGAGGGSDHAYTDYAYTTPTAPTSATVARVNDAQATISFTPASSKTALYQGHRLERSVNGGSYSLLYNLSATATSYIDNTVQPNSFYRYRVRSYNSAGASAYVETSTIYNTPAAPGKPTVGRSGASSIVGTFTNSANTASAIEVERSQDQSAWTKIATIAGTSTQFEDTPGGGTFYYRLRATRGSLVSAWTYSDAVVTITPPAAPTITSPAQGAVIQSSESTILISWQHNPLDGSAQTAAELRYQIDDGSWTTKSFSGTTSSYSIANTLSVNSTIRIQARTKGQHADFGPWSSVTSATVRQAPSIMITAPAEGFVIESVPLRVTLTYQDQSGTLVNGQLSIKDSSGQTVYTRDVTASQDFTIAEAEWLPRNETTYTLHVDVRSSSTLSASADRSVRVEFTPPNTAVVGTEPDSSTGYIAITVRESVEDGRAPMKSATLWRVDGTKRVTLGTGLADGTQIIDRFAPLNKQFSYETASLAASGSVADAQFEGKFDSDYFFIYAGDVIARAKINTSDSVSVTPEWTTTTVAGRTYPVATISDRLQETHDIGAECENEDEANAFVSVIQSGQVLIAKTLTGDVFHCVATLKSTPTLSSTHRWSVSISLTRVDGDEL